jgi:DNA polymerase
VLAAGGVAREEVFVTNVLKARPPKNRPPKAAEVAHCLPWLQEQVALVDPRVILLMGRHALVAFVPGAKITEVHGAPVEQAGRTLLPMYHPAAALRRPELRDVLFADVAALAALR